MSDDNTTHPFTELCQEISVEYLFKDFDELDDTESRLVEGVASKMLLKSIGDQAFMAHKRKKSGGIALEAFCKAIKPDEESGQNG